MIGKNIKIFDELDSTNNFVKRNISNLKHGCVVVSKKQTEGRGRRDNIWMSKEGNLYFSIVLKESIYRSSIFKYIVYSSVTLIETLKEYKIEALIKYPNDCLIESKKVSGILIESSGSMSLEYLVIGIGININQVKFNELSSKATSLKMVLEKSLDVDEVLQRYLKKFNDISNLDYNDVFKMYLNYSIVLDKKIKYQDEEYIISDIEKDGTLLIKNSLGERRVAYSEISLKEFY